MRRNQRGFTLIELMIVVAILGILASIAVPLYRGYITDARKAEARTNLQAIRLLQEQYFTDEGQYAEGDYKVGDVGLSADAVLPAFKPGEPEALRYDYEVVGTKNADDEITIYTATAYLRADDTQGTYFSIDQDNVRKMALDGEAEKDW